MEAVSNSYRANTTYDILIVGGGLAGLISAIELSRKKKNVLLIEKKEYPFHKVCGEYVSNEVLGYLRSLGFDPMEHGASTIKRLRLSTPKGKNIYVPLDLGGFGLSRYTMDKALCELAKRNGATVLTGTRVIDISFADDVFTASTSKNETYTSLLIIGSYGKRDMLDKKLDRDFLKKHTGYLGVKYHIKTDYPVNEVGLDNFDGGYCGIARIEEGKYNLCYLYRQPEKKNYKGIDELQEKILYKNPVLKQIFTGSEFLYDSPEVINEICFSSKKIIENHVLMCGDSAGLITPLCGNGMSMAIATGKLLSELIVESGFIDEPSMNNRTKLEQQYTAEWNRQFKKRLFWGRTIQQFFGNALITDAAMRTIHALPPVERKLLSYTHGKPL
jgi:flavin-dependent dehydrogenase